jgi:signal peptidase I
MNNIKKEIDEFIGETPRITESLRNKIISQATAGKKPTGKSNNYNQLKIGFLSLVLIAVVIVFVFSNIPPSLQSAKVLKDEITKPIVEFVEASDNTFEIMYGGPNMDRGNHDFANEHQIVIEKSTDVQRGDIIYFKYPEDDGLPKYNPDDYLARVVGLPGETIEIKDGQVYVDNQKLVAFYGESRRLGRNMEEWLENNSSSNLTEEDFNVDMEPTQVPESSVFVLSDDWIRGASSINFGPVDISEIEGKVLGYLKEE